MRYLRTIWLNIRKRKVEKMGICRVTNNFHGNCSEIDERIYEAIKLYHEPDEEEVEYHCANCFSVRTDKPCNCKDPFPIGSTVMVPMGITGTAKDGALIIHSQLFGSCIITKSELQKLVEQSR